MALDNEYQESESNVWNKNWLRYISLTIWGLLCVFLLQKTGILGDKRENNPGHYDNIEQVIKDSAIENNIQTIKIDTSSTISDTFQWDKQTK